MTVQYQEWRDEIDKKDWGDGPWQREPDRIQWQDAKTGMPCLLVRSETSGILCGYVGVNDKHQLFGVSYMNVEESIDVHGGLTYSDKCQGRICHVAEPDEEVWWFGFDCGHGFDVHPGFAALYKKLGREALTSCFTSGTYRTVSYVREQCAQLAKQLVKRDGWTITNRAAEVEESIKSWREKADFIVPALDIELPEESGRQIELKPE